MSPNEKISSLTLRRMWLFSMCITLMIPAIYYADQRSSQEIFIQEPNLQIDELIQETMDIKQESKKKEAMIREARIVAEAKAEAARPKPIYEQRLGKELVDYTIEICNNYKVDPKLVFAVIERESNYVSDVISSTQDYGLMQINIVNHPRLKKELKISNFLDAKSNIFAGVYMLAGIQANNYSNLHQVLMVYNQGGGSARNSWSNGVNSSEYSREIINRIKEL